MVPLGLEILVLLICTFGSIVADVVRGEQCKGNTLLQSSARSTVQNAVDAQSHQGFGIGSESGRALLVDNAEVFPGCRLHAVHVHRLAAAGVLMHSRHPVLVQRSAESSAAANLTIFAGDLASRRDEVRLLVALNEAAYGAQEPYSEAGMKPILESGESLFGPDVKTFAEEQRRTRTINDQLRPQLKAMGEMEDSQAWGMDANDRHSWGVHAYEYHKDGWGTVLVFRGSYSDGDYGNILVWIRKWITQRGDYQLKRQWLELANLSWDSVAKPSLSSNSGTSLDKIAWLLASKQKSNAFADELEAAAREKSTMGKEGLEKLAKTGYWEMTKQVAGTAVEAFNTKNLKGMKAVGEHFRISGHSQGGARAALASMFLEKKLGVKYNTTTFASVGGACFSRDLPGGGNLLDDVDPYIVHDQITDYAHVLDVYGNFDYDPGWTCSYGTTNIMESLSYKYCKEMFGYGLTSLMVASSAKLAWHGDLQEKFQRCLYFNHWSTPVRLDLEKESFLHSDGTTDAGCRKLTIPKKDPLSRCPTAESSWGWQGCDTHSSCAACVESATVWSLGVGCTWCAEDKKCKSALTGWFGSCSKQCDVVSEGNVSEGSSR